MAEGFAKRLGLTAESAGVKAGSGPSPNAVKVMQECEIDISRHVSRQFGSAAISQFDKIICLCRREEVDFPGDFETWNIDDPYGGSLEAYRAARDQIKIRVEGLACRLQKPQ